MPNSQIHTAISQARYSRYMSACGSKQSALKLYRANIILSQKLFGVISMFEVILRNSIDRHMISRKGNLWLEDAVDTGGYLYINSGCEVTCHLVQEAIYKLGLQYTHDRLIAKMTFGFWVYQFATKEFAASGSTLLNIFPSRPFGAKQKDIFRKLTKINDIRNRIAHHEPICFDGNIISTASAERGYDLIIELLGWLGCNPKQILYGINGIRKAISAINSIR